MNKTLLTIVAILFATFTCYAQTVTIDFSEETKILQLLQIDPNQKFTEAIQLKGKELNADDVSVCFSSTNNSDIDWEYVAESGKNFANFIKLQHSEYSETDINLSISVPSTKCITSIVITFEYYNTTNGQFTSNSELAVDITNNKGTVTWSGESASVSFNAKGFPFRISKIVITYGLPTGILDSTQSQRPYSVIAGNGKIKVNGEWNSIRMFNSNGQLISANKDNVHCPAGTYLVQVNGDKAELVIVK